MTPPEYVAARAVLLDAVEALGSHLNAAVLVGAQAVYLHTGDADLAVAPTTTDADIALVPSELSSEPLIDEALRNAGLFPVQTREPGMDEAASPWISWSRRHWEVPVVEGVPG